MKKLLLIILLQAMVIILLGQSKQYLFANYNKKQGLPHNRITSFLRDRQGFVWIGTFEGLCRFDGYNFRVFINNTGDSTSIRSNNIKTLFQDHTGKIWVGNSDFMDIFDPTTETFTHSQTLFNNRIFVPLQSKWVHFYDHKGNIIYANSENGLYKYSVTNDSVIKIPLPKELRMGSATTDNNDNIWITSKNAVLYKINNQNWAIIDSFKLPYKFDNLYKILIDRDNDIWLYDWNNDGGVYFINNKTRLMKHLSNDSHLSRLSNSFVYDMAQNSDGKIWIAVDHGGLNILDKSNFSIQFVFNNPLNDRSICDNSITKLYRDNQDFIWIGSYTNGLSYYHKNLHNIDLYKINTETSLIKATNDVVCFAEDRKHNLWLGTNGGGLIYYDRTNNTYKQFLNDPTNPNSLSSNIIISLYVDGQNNVWAGTYYGGISIFNGRIFFNLKNEPNNPQSLTDDRVWDISPSNTDNLYAVTLKGGINIIDTKTRQIKNVIRWNGKDKGVRAKVTYTAIEDSQGILWIGSDAGVRTYDTKTGNFEVLEYNPKKPGSISNNLIVEIIEDSRGLIWIASSDGLNLFDRTTKTFTSFKKEQGLCSNFITSIIEDKNKNLWLGTSSGISNLVITTDAKLNLKFTFHNYDEYDGLQGSEFNSKGAFLTSWGDILFGGPGGFNMFNPNNISIKNNNSPTAFTDFQIYNKSITNKVLINNRYVITKSINYTKQIELNYKENLFSIEFANLNFFHPARRKYKYMLENFNNDWLFTDAQNRRATFTNLAPGKYVLKVVTTNTDNTWQLNESRFTIIIKPPWWKTWLFKTIIILIIIAFILFIYYSRVNQLKKQKAALEKEVLARTTQLKKANELLEDRQEEVTLQNEELERHRNQLEQLVHERTSQLEKAKNKAEESDKLKSAFLANMSHEIRTPMNAILGFSSLLAEKNNAPEEQEKFIDIINNNCNTLLVLINDILDLAKIEANHIHIQKTKFNLTSLLRELEHYYSIKPKPAVHFEFVNKEELADIYIFNDANRVRQILINLLNNAFKYTEIGKIVFGYRLVNNMFEFYVTDTGIGIKEDDIAKLFQHFTKIETKSKLYRGSGLGLAISKRLAELMGGFMKVRSSFGEGSTFSLFLPNK